MAPAGRGHDDQQCEEGDQRLHAELQHHAAQPLGAGLARSSGAVRQQHILDIRGHRMHEGGSGHEGEARLKVVGK